MKLSTIIKGSVCVLGLVGVGNFFAAPANAGDAAARGAVTVVRPSGSSISVSGELTAPTGTQFPGSLTITPTVTGAGTNAEVVDSLEIDPGTIEASALETGGTIEGAVAALITGFSSIEDVTALVRAASVGGLE
ncbi:hypothetical protein H6G93_15200 [Nostoc sp. FACHB-973]|nr:hypothetical protein [Nostoc sp. FACHB-973]